MRLNHASPVRLLPMVNSAVEHLGMWHRVSIQDLELLLTWGLGFHGIAEHGSCAHTADKRRSGSAWCAIGSFGGGLLGGDEVDMAVEVDPNATLTLVTQDPQVTKS